MHALRGACIVYDALNIYAMHTSHATHGKLYAITLVALCQAVNRP